MYVFMWKDIKITLHFVLSEDMKSSENGEEERIKLNKVGNQAREAPLANES